eukprot:164767_1
MAATTSLLVPRLRNNSDIRSHRGSVSINDIKPKEETLNHIKRMSKIGGFAGSIYPYKIILGLYMIGLIASSVIIFRDTVCIWLNIYVTICQIDGLICFIFGMIKINDVFILQLSKHISYLDEFCRQTNTNISSQQLYASPSKKLLKKNSKYIFSQFISGQKLLKREITIISILFFFAYVSALVIVFDIFDTRWSNLIKPGNDNHDTIDYMLIIITDVLDFLRYIPSVILILLIRLYFSTFSSELTAFRQRHDIITRFEKLDDIPPQQSDIRKNISLVSNVTNVGSDIPTEPYQIIQNDSNPNLNQIDENKEQKTNHNEIPVDIQSSNLATNPKSSVGCINNRPRNLGSVDFPVNCGYLVILDMTHYQFKNEMETIIFPYRNMARNFRIFFITYLTLNSLCFVFVLITTIKGFSSDECDANNVYYLHYVTEMTVYFVGWVSLMIPLAENHRKLRSLNRDVKSKIVFKNATEQILIHQYLDSIVSASPFAVGYIMPTYSKLGFVFYVLFSIVGGQLLSFFLYNSNKM